MQAHARTRASRPPRCVAAQRVQARAFRDSRVCRPFTPRLCCRATSRTVSGRPHRRAWGLPAHLQASGTPRCASRRPSHRDACRGLGSSGPQACASGHSTTRQLESRAPQTDAQALDVCLGGSPLQPDRSLIRSPRTWAPRAGISGEIPSLAQLLAATPILEVPTPSGGISRIVFVAKVDSGKKGHHRNPSSGHPHVRGNFRLIRLRAAHNQQKPYPRPYLPRGLRGPCLRRASACSAGEDQAIALQAVPPPMPTDNTTGAASPPTFVFVRRPDLRISPHTMPPRSAEWARVG